MKPDAIRRDVEVRAENRRLTGAALVYGDVSRSHRERFEPGAVRIAPLVALNWRHRPMDAICWTGAGLDVEDTAGRLEIRAEVPETPLGDLALAAVRAGRATGLSVEFRPSRERRDAGGLRVIESADVWAIALVPQPSYDASRVENRERRRIWLL